MLHGAKGLAGAKVFQYKHHLAPKSELLKCYYFETSLANGIKNSFLTACPTDSSKIAPVPPSMTSLNYRYPQYQPGIVSPTPSATMSSQRFCLRWNNHQSNLLSVFDQLLHDESFVDVTLAVEGQLLRAHKMVLSACSPYFQALFVNHPDKHPIVILKDVPYSDMKSLLDFMYRGEVSHVLLNKKPSKTGCQKFYIAY